MSETSLQYYKGYLVTQLEKLEKENLKISEQNLKYKYLAQIGLSSEKILEDVKDSLERILAHSFFLKSSEKTNSSLENHAQNLESTINKTIKNISQNLDALHHSHDSSKNMVFEK